MKEIYTIEEYAKWLKENKKTSTYKNLMEFKSECEDRIFTCPACSEEYVEEDLECLYDEYNTDGVCDQCIINGYYE